MSRIADKNFKGLVIEFGADFSKLDKSISESDKKTKAWQKELSQVEKLLKFDPKNTDLLAQRQELLGRAVEQTRAKLEALRGSQERMQRANAANADWEKAYEPLGRAIEETQKKLAGLLKQDTALKRQLSSGEISDDDYAAFRKTLDETQDHARELQQAVKDLDAQFADGHVSDDEYRKFQRELVKTEADLQSLEKRAKSSDTALEKLSKGAKTAGDKIGAAADKVKGLSAAAAGVVTAAVAAVESTREFRQDIDKLETNAQLAGMSLDVTSKAMEDLAAVTGETDSNVEALSNLLATGANANQMQSAVELLSGAVIKFPDTMKIESLADSLQETLATGAATGQFAELLGRLGVSTDDFNEQLGKMAPQSERVSFALNTLANTGMQSVYAQYVQGNRSTIEYTRAQYEFQQALAELGQALEPLVTQGMQMLVQVLQVAAEWFGRLSPETRQWVATIAMLVAALAPVLMIVSSVFKTISSVANGVKGLGDIASAFSEGAGNKAYMTFVKWVAIIIAVVAAVAALVALINVLVGKGDEMGRAMGSVSNVMGGGSRTPNIPAYASGTESHPGGLALVGEQGAELISLPRGAKVYNNRETRDMLGAGSTGSQGDIFNISVSVEQIKDFQALLDIAKDARRMERMGTVKS